MEAAVITAVGIDVSKSKSTVAIRRPGGEIALQPFEVHHTNSDLKKLASTLKKLGGDIRIVMEHTSTYWRPIALTLKEAGFFTRSYCCMTNDQRQSPPLNCNKSLTSTFSFHPAQK